jgi:hypothetical protein
VISGNHSGGNGGGLINYSFVTAYIKNSLIAGNSANGGGGGIYEGALASGITLSAVNILGNEPDNCEPPGSIPACTG